MRVSRGTGDHLANTIHDPFQIRIFLLKLVVLRSDEDAKPLQMGNKLIAWHGQQQPTGIGARVCEAVCINSGHRGQLLQVQVLINYLIVPCISIPPPESRKKPQQRVIKSFADDTGNGYGYGLATIR